MNSLFAKRYDPSRKQPKRDIGKMRKTPAGNYPQIIIHRNRKGRAI